MVSQLKAPTKHNFYTRKQVPVNLLCQGLLKRRPTTDAYFAYLFAVFKSTLIGGILY